MITFSDFKGLLDSKNVSYGLTDSGNGILFSYKPRLIPYDLKSVVYIENGMVTIHLRAIRLSNVISREMKDLINNLNRNYKYYSFYHDDGYLWMSCNAIVKDNRTCDEIALLMRIGYEIADNVYPMVLALL